MICSPEAVVMAFPAVCAIAAGGIETTEAVTTVNAMAARVENIVRGKRCMVTYLLERSGLNDRASVYLNAPCKTSLDPAGSLSSISERAAVLAGIGAAGQRPLLPIDPDRLTATERRDDLGGLVSELLQTCNDVGGHAVLELIDAFIMQAARHTHRLLHVASIVQNVGQHVGLADRLVLTTHDTVRHHRAATLGGERRHDGVQRSLARRDAETGTAILEENASLVRNDRRRPGMGDRVDERADVAVLVHHRDVNRRRIHRRRHLRQIQHSVHADLADYFFA